MDEMMALARNVTFKLHVLKGYYVRLKRTVDTPIEFHGTDYMKNVQAGTLLFVDKIQTSPSTDGTDIPDFLITVTATDSPGQPQAVRPHTPPHPHTQRTHKPPPSQGPAMQASAPPRLAP